MASYNFNPIFIPTRLGYPGTSPTPFQLIGDLFASVDQSDPATGAETAALFEDHLFRLNTLFPNQFPGFSRVPFDIRHLRSVGACLQIMAARRIDLLIQDPHFLETETEGDPFRMALLRLKRLCQSAHGRLQLLDMEPDAASLLSRPPGSLIFGLSTQFSS